MGGVRTSDLPGVGTRLRQAREAAGLSQSQVATLMRLTRPAITEMENETRRVSAGELKALSKIYRVSLDWLAGEEIDESRAIKMAARKLGGLKKKDLKTVLRIIESLGREREGLIRP